MRTIEDVIAQAIQEQWAAGADRTVMTYMVQNAVRDAIEAECVPCVAETAPHTCQDRESETEPIVALVTVDDRGHLIPSEDGRPGSTVTVGDDTWSVPNKVQHGGVMWWPRVGYALREWGWRPVRGAELDHSRPGVIGVPVERIETEEG